MERFVARASCDWLCPCPEGTSTLSYSSIWTCSARAARRLAGGGRPPSAGRGHGPARVRYGIKSTVSRLRPGKCADQTPISLCDDLLYKIKTGWQFVGQMPSPITGANGAVEAFVLAQRSTASPARTGVRPDPGRY